MTIEQQIYAYKKLKENNQAFFVDTHEEADRIIEALEKQIPKKPDFEADGYADGQLVYDTWICPCCGVHYEVDYDDFKYCPECGQAIDWSDKE